MDPRAQLRIEVQISADAHMTVADLAEVSFQTP